MGTLAQRGLLVVGELRSRFEAPLERLILSMPRREGTVSAQHLSIPVAGTLARLQQGNCGSLLLQTHSFDGLEPRRKSVARHRARV